MNAELFRTLVVLALVIFPMMAYHRARARPLGGGALVVSLPVVRTAVDEQRLAARFAGLYRDDITGMPRWVRPVRRRA
jgi:hypothetical protein